MAIIKSGATSDQLTVDPTSKAARTTLYDESGNPIALSEGDSVVPGSTAGVLMAGADNKIVKLVRMMSDGSIAQSNPMVAFHDPVEGSAVNTQLWTQAWTTMTATQASGVITLNAGSSAATTVGVLHIGQRLIPILGRSNAVFRTRQRHTAHFNNNLIELGLVSPVATSATTTLQVQGASGAVWQKDGTGQYIPSLFIGGSLTAGTPISNAAFLSQVAATDYATFEVEVDDKGANFRIRTASGVIVTGSDQRIDFPANTADWTVTHLAPYLRTYNSAATGTAVQTLVAETTVHILDVGHTKPWADQMSANTYAWYQNPVTGFAQTANYTNNAAPTTRTVTNTTALEATLGGQVSWNNAGTSFAGSDTADYILFGYQVPSPVALHITGLRIETVNLGAANAAAPYTILYSLAVNSNAVSLATAAPNAPRFIPLGVQTLAASSAIGIPFSPTLTWTPRTPVVIQPGRFVHVVGRVLAGTATASQVIRTIATFDGYYE